MGQISGWPLFAKRSGDERSVPIYRQVPKWCLNDGRLVDRGCHHGRYDDVPESQRPVTPEKPELKIEGGVGERDVQDAESQYLVLYFLNPVV
jgi:hypothetical protein